MDMPTARNACTAIPFPNGDILVVGGIIQRRREAVSTVELLTRDCDSGTRVWRRLAPMLVPRVTPGAAFIDRRVVAAGGGRHDYTVEVFLPPPSPPGNGELGQWTMLSKLDKHDGGGSYLADRDW